MAARRSLAPLVILVLVAAARASGAMNVSPNLVAVLMRDAQVAACARESDKTAEAYVTQAFALRSLTLRDGARMTIAIATDGCLFLGQSSRIMIFQDTGRGYRRVLDEPTLSGFAVVNEDGTAVLPTHETMETIFESAYVWDGQSYTFSAPRSHIYDVQLDERKPYEIAVRFPPGSFSTTLAGSAALNFGQLYFIKGREGQSMTIELTKHTGPRPAILLSYGERKILELKTKRWLGKLPLTGIYKLSIIGSGESDATLVSRYTLRLSIY